MQSGNRLYATLLLIRHSLCTGQSHVECPAADREQTTAIAPGKFAAVLGHPEKLLRRDGTLELLFCGALAPAAPFLLYRLKSLGYSTCRAEVTAEGIRLTASR